MKTKPRRPVDTPATDAKRDRILRTAERLFFERGYDRTTLDLIAAELEVTKPFLYYYFDDKQHILETLSWTPAVATLTSFDLEPGDTRPPHVLLAEGFRRLVRRTIEHYPAGFFVYREPQAYRPEYRAATKRLLDHFYTRLYALLETGRAAGTLDFADTSVTALAACSLPGFLYTWYRPDGRFDPDATADELTELALRMVGLSRRLRDAARSSAAAKEPIASIRASPGRRT